MELKTYFAQDASGNIMPGATVTVYEAGTATLATGLQDESGSPLANPFAADSSAKVAFYAPDGLYDITVAGNSRTVTIRAQFVSVDGASVLRADLAATGGSALVGFQQAGTGAVDRTVQDKLREVSVSITDYASLKDAINALPNVTLRGAKMPTFSANCDRLEGGSIIEGRFNVFADNFAHENLGYDLGKYVCDTRFPGYDTHASDYPLAGGTSTWDAFAFGQPNQVAPLPDRKNYTAKNIVGLLRDSQSVGHAILQEGFSGGHIDNVVGMYAIHANVIKAQNVTCGYIAGYGASGEDVILKSDSYAHGGNIKIDTVETGKAPPDTTPWSTPAKSAYALFLHPATDSMDTIKIGKARLKGAAQLIGADGPAANVLDGLSINTLELEGFGDTDVIGMYFRGVNFYRINFGNVVINNVADAVAYDQPASLGFQADPMIFGSLSLSNVSLRCLQALNYGSFVIDVLRTTNSIGTLYAIADTGRVHVGKESLFGTLTTKFSASPPTLNAAWQNYPAQGPFRLMLENYGVRLAGLLQPVGGGSGTVFSLPPYLRPSVPVHTPAVADGTGGQVCRQIEAGPGIADVLINSGGNAAGAENWLSLDGVTWKLD